MAIFLFIGAKNTVEQKRLDEFKNSANEIVDVFEKNLQGYFDILVANAQFIMSSDEVTEQEFRNFTGKLLDTYPGIQSLVWNQKVTLAQRAAFENYIRAQGFPNYEIWERLGNGQKRVFYIVPAVFCFPLIKP